MKKVEVQKEGGYETEVLMHAVSKVTPSRSTGAENLRGARIQARSDTGVTPYCGIARDLFFVSLCSSRPIVRLRAYEGVYERVEI